MSNAKVLVERFLTQPERIICVNTTPASVVDLNFKPSNWLGCMKEFNMMWNWSLLSMTMGLNDSGLLLMHKLVILIILIKYSLFCRMSLRWLHDNLSGPGEEELLQLKIVILNSSFLEKEFYSKGDIELILSRMLISTLLCKAVLKERCKAHHKSSMFKHSWPLYLIASIVRGFHLLTQFISSQGFCLLLVISCILLSKKVCLVILTVFQKDIQFLDDLYYIRLLLQSSFH